MIIVQSPLRISLFGGGTDLPDFYLKEGGCVLSSTIDKYIFVIIKKRFDRLLRVGYTKTELVEQVDDLQHELIREAFRKTGVSEGVEVTTMGDIPSEGSGLGSSSTVTVGTLHALYTFLGENVPAERLAREACEIEIDVLGKPIGVQDQYISAHGGFRFLEFLPTGEIIVQRIALGRNEKRRLEDNLMLFFTGISRKSETILGEQKSNISERKDVLNEMKSLAYLAKENLVAGKFDELGDMMHYNWNLKKRLASNITTSTIDDIYMRAKKAGALGGKITGAGGGGFLLLYCPQEKQESVRDALQDLQDVPFSFEPDGVKVIFNYRRGPEDENNKWSIGYKKSKVEDPLPKTQDSSETQNPIEVLPPNNHTYETYVSETVQTLSNLSFEDIDEATQILHEARLTKRNIFIFGNGGSAATASHFVCDLSKNTQVEKLPDFCVIGLADNVPLLSALANDSGYENVFVQPLATMLNPGDIAIAISASGNSQNVLKAINYAKELGAMTIGFTGFDGGELGKMADIHVHVPSDSIEQVEDIHLLMEHMITKALREKGYVQGIDVLDHKALSESIDGVGRFPLTEHELPEGEPAPLGFIHDRDSLRLIYSINRILAENGNSARYLEDVLQITLERIGATSGSFYILDKEGKPLAGVVAYDGQVRRLPQDEKIDILDKGLAAWVLDTQTPAIVSSTDNDPRWLRRNWAERQGIPRSAISVPLNFNDKISGVLTLVQSRAEMFRDQDLAVLSAIASCASVYNSQIEH